MSNNSLSWRLVEISTFRLQSRSRRLFFYDLARDGSQSSVLLEGIAHSNRRRHRRRARAVAPTSLPSSTSGGLRSPAFNSLDVDCAQSLGRHVAATAAAVAAAARTRVHAAASTRRRRAARPPSVSSIDEGSKGESVQSGRFGVAVDDRWRLRRAVRCFSAIWRSSRSRFASVDRARDRALSKSSCDSH